MVLQTKLRLESGGIEHVVDLRLEDRYPQDVCYNMVRLALDCASFDSASRPSMKVWFWNMHICWEVNRITSHYMLKFNVKNCLYIHI